MQHGASGAMRAVTHGTASQRTAPHCTIMQRNTSGVNEPLLLIPSNSHNFNTGFRTRPTDGV